MRFRDRVAIVTGGGSGIGRVMAIRFAAEGAKVAVVDSLAERAQLVAAEIQESGGIAVAHHAGVSSGSEVQSMVASIAGQLGPVDGLINNAAIAEGDDLIRMEQPVWGLGVHVLLHSVFLRSNAVLPSVIKRP